MKKIIKNMNEQIEITDLDLGEIARLIREGNTSGRLDSEDGKKISWELKTEVWKD